MKLETDWLMHQDVGAAIGEGDDQVYQDKHQIVMPARTFLAPEPCVPSENLFLNGAERDQDQTEVSKLGENSQSHPQASRDLGDAQEDCEGLAHSDALGAPRWIFKMAVAAGDKD